MNAGLRDYQIDAINRLRTGSILCGGVGSGKSRTSLAYYYKEQGGDLYSNENNRMDNPKDLYIITTARKRDTLEWEAEFPLFLLSKNMDVYDHKVIVDSWNNIAKYKNITNSFFIFDEQRVVGYGTWSKAFIKIARANDWILLSATPGDTWSDYIPVFIANGFYKNKTEFTREHCIYSRFTKYPKIDRYVNTRRLVRLRDKILVDMDYNRKTESINEDIYCGYNKQLYKTIGKERWNVFEDKPIENASELCYLWRKVVNSAESRQEMVLNLAEDHKRLIIFYNFDYELDILKSMTYINDGDVMEIAEWNGHKHQPIPDVDKWVYLVQYNAGAEGWNCIKTDTIIFYSQNYSYKMLEQAKGRIDRLNTPFEKLYYYHLKSHSNIDLAISNALRNKKAFNESRWVRSFNFA